MNNPQCQKVLSNKGKIVGALKLTEGATENLTTEFQQKSWIPDTENPTPDRLVGTALGRIKLDPAEYDIFIGMLKAVPGLDTIVKILEGSPPLTDRTSRQSTDDEASMESPSYTQGRVDLGTVISIGQLDKIARELLIKWEDLSPSLRLKQQQEQVIRESYRGEYADQKREALRAWKRNEGEEATFGALIAAAKDISNMQLAHDIRDLMKTLQVETQGKERSQQRQGEQYDDEPDRGDENGEKKQQKTKPHQAGQLQSDSGPRSLTEGRDLRRRKQTGPSPKMDKESATNTPLTEGNGGQSTNNEGTGNNEEDSKQKNSEGSDLVMEATTRGIHAKAKNMTEPTAIHAVKWFALMVMVMGIVYVIGQCVNSYITTIYQKQ